MGGILSSFEERKMIPQGGMQQLLHKVPHKVPQQYQIIAHN